MPVRLTPHPDESIFATDYLYANAAFGRPHHFVIESRKGDENSRDVHSSFLTSNQTRLLRDELTAFLGEKDGVNGMALVAWTALNNENKRLKIQRDHDITDQTRLFREKQGLNDANEALRRDNADLTTQNQRLRQANFRLQISTVPMDVYGELKRKHAELNDVFEESNRQYTELRERYKNLQSESGKHIVKSVELNAENEKLRQRVASLEKDAADLQKRRDHVDGLWTETIEDRHRQIRDLQAENARLKVDLMNARARTTATIIVKGY